MNDAMADFYRRKVEEWTAKSLQASHDGNLAAFEFAEQEIAIYKQMLERVK